MKSDTFFHSIILPQKDVLYRLALSLVKDKLEAEDIVQDVFLKLWDKRDEWKNIENVEAYCFRMAKNLSLDRMTSLRMKTTESISSEDSDYKFVDSQTPLSQFERMEKRQAIDKSIELLPENQRMVFQLREVEGMSYQEIAATLNISEELVKVSLYRARNKLKDLLSQKWQKQK